MKAWQHRSTPPWWSTMSGLYPSISASIATAVCNLDSSRVHRGTPLFGQEKRSEGWTEVWGSDIVDERWRHEELDTFSPFPDVEISITQHRPAWFEQLALRIAGVPFVVLNSPYAATEATGPLPYLRDLRPGEAPVLVGRNHPSDPFGKLSILEHLRWQRKIDLDSTLTTSEAMALSQLYINLISTTLQTILMVLRYDDDDAWARIVRPQCLRAASSLNSWLTSTGTWFTAWSERAVARYSLGPCRPTVPRALEIARDCYQMLEAQLIMNKFLLGGSKATLADAVLFDHLANALGDIHLTTVLADFPNLSKYFENIYNNFFASGDENWMHWNREQNCSNAFQPLPLVSTDGGFQSDDFIHNLPKLLYEMKARQVQLDEMRKIAYESTGASSSDKAASEGAMIEADDNWLEIIQRKTKPNETTWFRAVVVVTLSFVALSLLRSRSYSTTRV